MPKQSKVKTTPQDDSQLQTRILLEEMNKGIKTIGEQHGTIVQRLDGIESKLSQHDQRFDKIESTLNSVKNAVMEVDTKVSKLEGRVGRIEDCVTKIDSKLETAVTNHEQRLQKLEAVR